MKRIGTVIENTIKELEIELPVRRHQAVTRWSSIVGEKISKVTKPERVDGDKIFVIVKNSSWRNELIFHKQKIIRKLNNQLGRGIIKDIIFL